MKGETIYDAIVIGCGMTGGWAAKELTEKGLKTLVLEAARPTVPEEDYVEHVAPWEMRFRGMRDRRRQMEDQPIQCTCYACDDWSAKFFVSDKEHPYTTVDAWGIPVLKISCSFGENELALRKDMSITAAEMLAAAGAHDIEPFADDEPPGFSIHEMGTDRMGRDAKTSVLNSYNQAHEIKNLFITDGGAMGSSSCVNPSLTYMALTARACDYAVQQLKKGEL